MKKFIAVYVRVSSKRQEFRSQEPDLQRWAAAQEHEVVWFRDKASGKSMVRPGWLKCEEAIRSGRCLALVCWRCDRLTYHIAPVQSGRGGRFWRSNYCDRLQAGF